jgi:metallo-beta-lactamase class B
MYVVTNDGVMLFDTPWDTTQFQPLLDSINYRHHKKVIACIATHFHEDRTGGLEYYQMQGVETFTTRLTDALSARKRGKRAEFLLDNDSVFHVGQYTFQTFYPGPGHAPDNIVIWFPNEKILYGGCLIKSTEATDLGNLSDANVNEWANSLLKIQEKFGKPEYIIPGHNSWNSNKSLEHTLRLIKKQKRK